MTMSFDELAATRCQARKGDADRLDDGTVDTLLGELRGWKKSTDGKSISRDFEFEDFRHTLGFINAVGYMANRADHHPDLEAGYGHCRVHWSTHDVGGLSMNDFICAAHVEKLVR